MYSSFKSNGQDLVTVKDRLHDIDVLLIDSMPELEEMDFPKVKCLINGAGYQNIRILRYRVSLPATLRVIVLFSEICASNPNILSIGLKNGVPNVISNHEEILTRLNHLMPRYTYVSEPLYNITINNKNTTIIANNNNVHLSD